MQFKSVADSHKSLSITTYRYATIINEPIVGRIFASLSIHIPSIRIIGLSSPKLYLKDLYLQIYEITLNTTLFYTLAMYMILIMPSREPEFQA